MTSGHFSLLARRYAGSGQWDRSLQTAQDWLAAEPDNAAAQRAAALALVNLERYREAEPLIAAALGHRPDDDFVHRLASIAAFNLKRGKAADDAIHRAISINPEDAGHWRHLAWMCYVQGDRADGLKWAKKARELAPNDVGTLNLLALCQPKTSGGETVRREYLREALALRPNDPNLQNNLGVQYLGAPPDYAAAEACFRRALSLHPTSKLFRRNLFLAIKARDPIYKLLCAPRDLTARFLNYMRPVGWRRIWLLPVVLFWLVVGRYLGAVLLAWAILVWPMVKVYEYLMLGDLRRKAGELGALRGGIAGLRSWPLHVRLGIFGALLLGFWAAMGWLAYATWQGSVPALCGLAGVAIAIVVTLWVVQIRGQRRIFRIPFLGWLRSRRFAKLARAAHRDSPPFPPS